MFSIKRNAACLLALTLPLSAIAETYLGAQIGQNIYHNQSENPSSTAYGLYMGYYFSPNWSVDFSWLDLGKARQQNMEGRFTAWRLQANYQLWQQDAWAATLGGGVAHWRGNSTRTSDGIGHDSDGWSPTARAAISYQLAPHWDTAISYQYIYKIGSDETRYADSHGLFWELTYRFGK